MTACEKLIAVARSNNITVIQVFYDAQTWKYGEPDPAQAREDYELYTDLHVVPSYVKEYLETFI